MLRATKVNFMIECRGAVKWVGSCYGVDLQAGKPVIVRAERTRGRVNCFPVAESDPSFANMLKSGRAIVAGSLTAGESLSCWLETPFTSWNKSLKVLPTLLDVQLPFALEDCAYDFIPAGEAKRTVSQGGEILRPEKVMALAVAARFVDVRKKIDTFKISGMDPVVLDQEGLALWSQSLFEVPVVPGGEHAPRVVIYLGSDRVTVAIGRGVDFISAHGVGGQPNAGQIARLLKAQLETPKGKTEADVSWLWAGPGVVNSDFQAKLQQSLCVDWPGASVVHDQPETFLARAVATRAITDGPLRCNLRSGVLQHDMITRRAETEHVRTASLCLAAGILLCAANITWGMMVNHRGSLLDNAVNDIKDKLAGFHVAAKGENGIKIVREAIGPRKELLKPFLRRFEPSLADKVVVLADLAKKNDLRYETFSLSREKVSVGGTAGGWKKCEMLLDALKQMGYAVKMDRKESLADERISFSVITAGGASE
ncbi:MAG: hypothetical protein A2283_10720 [Lentisphaerae bacterium RIFOXYA12_FULL_48_11]|nr:MAG: hypothetical protein A2283_10720 [Lentisphaerae bacterium RIFOXYA12_FULL_48_11]